MICSCPTLFGESGTNFQRIRMMWHLCIFLTFVVGGLSAIITEYQSIQEDGYVTDLDMLHCQLRANGNLSCAIRFDTTVTSGVLEELERCEELDVDWCHSVTLDPGYTYVGKSTVVYTPPFVIYHHGGNTWEIWENIPIAIKAGAELSVTFTTSTMLWTKIRINFYNAAEANLYQQAILSADGQISSGVETSITAVFDATQITLFIEGQVHSTSVIGAVTDIRILQFVFFDYEGVVNQVAYRAGSF